MSSSKDSLSKARAICELVAPSVIWRGTDIPPTRNTRYASHYGVGIIGIDMNEPNPTPHDLSYIWDEGFVEYCKGWSEDSDWMPSTITHWTELPERPCLPIKTE